MGELRDAFEDAVRGKGAIQIVLGDPGVGKTRLAAALAEHAAAGGARVVWTRGWGRAAPPYWPWVEVVRGLAEDLDAAQLRIELGPVAGELLRLAPELAERLPELEPPGEQEEPDAARFALFDAIVGLLRARAARGPVVILIDDLQAVDEGSLVALDFVSRMLRDLAVLLVVTLHERVPRRTPDAQLALQNIVRAGRRLLLGGLAVGDIGRLIELTSGGPAARGVADVVHAATEGNVFFAREIVALLVADGRLQDPPSELPLPEGVRATIARRMEPLAQDELAALELAAVIGRTFDLATLERASELDRDGLLAALDEAVALGLVREIPGTPGRYRFGHGLIRDTLIAGLPAAARMNAHRLVGAALEHVYRGAIEDHLPELAHHFLSAAPRGDVPKAVDYAERAAQRALQTLAYEQSAELYGRALQALAQLPPDVPRRARLLLGLGTAQSRAGRPTARASFEAAVAAARAIGADDVLARAALGFAPFALTPGYVDEPHVALLVEALERVGSADDPMRVRLLGALAVALYWSDSADRRAQLATEALAMARRLGDEATLAIALCSAQLATCGPDATEQGLAWLRELFELTDRTGETTMSLAARSRHVDLLLELDDLAGADIAVETLDRLARESRDRRPAAFAALHRARRAAMDGCFGEAAQQLGDVAATADELPASTIPLTVASQHVILTWLQKGPREIGEIVRAYAAGSPAMPCWRAGLTAALADGGRVDEARLEFDRLAAQDFAALPRDNLWMAAMALLCEAVAALDLREEAPRLHARLARFAGRNVVLPTIAFLGPVEMWLGILARVAGRDAEALERFATARIRATRIGARGTLARIALEEAVVLARDGGSSARARAEELLADVADASERMGLVRYAERIEMVRGQLRGTPAASGEAREAGWDHARLHRAGDIWTVEYEGGRLHLSDRRGVRLLALLLERPGTEVHCMHLIAAVEGTAAIGPSIERSDAHEIGLGIQRGTGPALDDQAKREYRDRIERLEAELDRARTRRDERAAGRVASELDFVRAELARGLGLSGRDRQPHDDAERARLSVTRALRSAIKRIGTSDPQLGERLDRCVRTGAYCVYDPGRERPLRWVVER